jgi:hypothetical protein
LAGIESALQLAESKGVEAQVSLSAAHSAIPLCILFDSNLREISEYPRMYEHEGNNPQYDASRWWAKGPGCAQCEIEGYCLGLPRSYSERFGFDELKPIG